MEFFYYLLPRNFYTNILNYKMVNQVNKKFLKSSHFISNLKLCEIRMIDNSKFPWIILIPKRKKISDISELNKKDRSLLMDEIVYCSNLMKKIFKTSKLNVEKIGNIVPQLHIHIIARKKTDITWPLSVWVTKSKPYTKKNLRFVINKISEGFSKKKR